MTRLHELTKHHIFLLVIVLLLSLGLLPNLSDAKPKRGSSSYQTKQVRQKEHECRRGPCAQVHEDENDDCMDKCVSPQCYEEIFAKNPLEVGEVDRERRTQFGICTRKEQEEVRKQKYIQTKEDALAKKEEA